MIALFLLRYAPRRHKNSKASAGEFFDVVTAIWDSLRDPLIRDQQGGILSVLHVRDRRGEKLSVRGLLILLAPFRSGGRCPVWSIGTSRKAAEAA